jgi:hypothetical protein
VTLVRSTRELSWSRCNSTTDGPQPERGSRILSDAQLAQVIASLPSIRLSPAQHCGEDAGVIMLDVTLASGVQHYVDDYYSGCPWDIHRGRTFVSGLEPLGGVLYELAR